MIAVIVVLMAMTDMLMVVVLMPVTDTLIKQQLSSLFYVKTVCDTRLQQLSDGIADTDCVLPGVSISWYHVRQYQASRHFGTVMSGRASGIKSILHGSDVEE